jgi:hypothetical protein
MWYWTVILYEVKFLEFSIDVSFIADEIVSEIQLSY